MKKKDIVVGLEVGFCENLREKPRYWTPATVLEIQQYYILLQFKHRKDYVSVNQIRPWPECQAENEARREAHRAAVQAEVAIEDARTAAVERMGAVVASHPNTVAMLTLMNIKVRQTDADVRLICNDPDALTKLLDALAMEWHLTDMVDET